MIQALQIALKISCQYFTIDILPYVDNCVCEPPKLNGSPFNICFESKAFNCNSLGLLEFVVVVYKAWLWNLYFYSRQLWLPTSICRWWCWKEKGKGGPRPKFWSLFNLWSKFSTHGTSWERCFAENDLLRMMIMIFCRSPSPEPIYSGDGKRLNTREYRKRKELEDTRF